MKISVKNALDRLNLSREELEKELKENDGEYAPGYFRFVANVEQKQKGV